MLSELSKLSSSERELVFKAPLLVCILIGGADGTIDNKELSEAINITRDRQWVKSVLSAFYQEVSEDFEDKLKVLIQSYPVKALRRNTAITEELSQLNSVWEKLGPEFSVAYFESLKYISHKIASASGGFWGKISQEEAKLLDLPMLVIPGNN
jgi:hypothetical protein